MYENHYGLTAKPFSIVPNPEMLFLSKNHQNALTYLEYGLSEKVGFILLTGEIGAGKTTLIRYLLNKIEAQLDTAVIFNTNFTSDQLLRRILSEFEIPAADSDKENHLERLYQFLIDRYAHGRHALLIIDEAQNLSDDALEDIRMLSNLQTDDQILLQIMLVGQPELKDRLNAPDFRQLSQRIAVNYHITPLDAAQTEHYIRYRLEKAGGSGDLFARPALETIYALSGGVPRTINLVCDTALVYGFADNLDRIDESVLQKVVEDKICMSINMEGSTGKPTRKVVAGSSGPGIMERIHALETALNDLKAQHAAFANEVRTEVLSRYRELLAAEQRRLDRLIAAAARRPGSGGGTDPAADGRAQQRRYGERKEKREAGNKYRMLLKMVESEKRIKEGETDQGNSTDGRGVGK